MKKIAMFLRADRTIKIENWKDMYKLRGKRFEVDKSNESFPGGHVLHPGYTYLIWPKVSQKKDSKGALIIEEFADYKTNKNIMMIYEESFNKSLKSHNFVIHLKDA